MLEIPKAHIPKRKDEKFLNVTVMKVEKSYEIDTWLDPKYLLQWEISR
mgnify:CR=1 FL=1